MTFLRTPLARLPVLLIVGARRRPLPLTLAIALSVAVAAARDSRFMFFDLRMPVGRTRAECGCHRTHARHTQVLTTE